jgi:hypothetical protein
MQDPAVNLYRRFHMGAHGVRLPRFGALLDLSVYYFACKHPRGRDVLLLVLLQFSVCKRFVNDYVTYFHGWAHAQG